MAEITITGAHVELNLVHLLHNDQMISGRYTYSIPAGAGRYT